MQLSEMTKSLGNQMKWVSSLNAHKLLNSTKLLTSYYESRLLGRPIIRGLPDAVSIEPTTSCNLRCPECPSGLRSFTRATGMMEMDNFTRIIDDISGHAFYLNMYFQGEPYLNPDFLEMIRYAKRNRLYTSTSTNAHFLDESKAEETVEAGLDRLIVSMDGLKQETYEKYRVGGSLPKVEAALRNLFVAKQKLASVTPFVELQFIAFGHNEHEIVALSNLQDEFGIDQVTVKTAQVYDHKGGSDLIPQDGRLSRYVRNGDGKWRVKSELPNHCWKMWHSCVITWDGDVLPCCFDKDGTYQMGNVLNVPLEDIWHGAAYNNFRQQLLSSRKQIDICQNCTEGLSLKWTEGN